MINLVTVNNKEDDADSNVVAVDDEESNLTDRID
jgi:hypothetical protein